ncbi:hypothetical protein [Flavobacterium aquidurense]|uniref:hypothetical protein n=1 Tax=Flavobacterium aquidurense TaxID=362413 RepID=UPI0028671A6A|nr:hypothetical protein [Flavobacterium aquidurense]MDR7371011.1 hypothetical protein [Flavobacterium aquidurense]
MKHTYINIILFLSLMSCESKKPIVVKQTISNEIVTILPSLKNPLIKDSIVISIPTEFEITINSSKLIGLSLYYKINKKTLIDHIFDYQVYNKQNKTEPIYSFESLSTDKPINIIIKERNHLISKKEGYELLKKYHIKRSIDNLKFGDTIKLAPYNEFRKKNNSIINDLKKINDSIFFRVTTGKEKPLIIKEKINW